MKTYGDEDFIRLIREGQEEARNKDIRKGSILADDEELVFKEREIIKNQLWMWLPEKFGLLGGELARVKYPNENRPELIYSNPETTVNISFSHKKDKLKAGQEPEIRNYMEQVILNLYPAAAVTDRALVCRENHDTAWFDFVTPAIDTQIYNLMFFTSVKGRLLMGACNCLSGDEDDWKDLFVQMLATIRVKE